MRLLLLASLLTVPACFGGERADTGECPAGETCSPDTPDGLEFVGTPLADTANVEGPSPTAVGGTQEIALEDASDDAAFELPYTVDDGGALGVEYVSHAGDIVTVRGTGIGANYLRILDTTGELYDRKQIVGAKIDSIQIIPAGNEQVPVGEDVVFAAGRVTFSFALWGQVQESSGPTEERLVDTSLTAQLANSLHSAWDTLELDGAASGGYAVDVAAGDLVARTMPVTVVDAPDAMSADDPPTTVPPADANDAFACFSATNAGRYVAGLEWTFTIDGVPQIQQTNCVSVVTAKTSGTVTVVASAGGQSATIQLAVGGSEHARRPSRAPRPAAGERAAM